jgi:glutaredoxin
MGTKAQAALPLPTRYLSRMHNSRHGMGLSLLLASALTGAGCDPLSFRDDAPRRPELAARAAQERPTVEVFVTDWCPFCQRLEAFLQKNDIEYVRLDIEKDGDAQREHRALGGGGGIPVTRIGSQVIWGYRPDVIGPLVGIKAD